MEFKAVRILLIYFVILSVLQHETNGWWRRRRRRRRPPPRRDCQVGYWSSWSSCNHRCGNAGTQTRTRSKTVTECCGGSCPYSLRQNRACNRNACQNGGYARYARCSCRRGWTGTCCERASPRDCQVGQWSSWSSCNHRCGSTGIQTRTRIKTVTECCGGSCPYRLSSTRACNRNACRNGGSSIPGRCSCTSGWKGTCCEIDRNECLNNPCDHTCVNVPGSYNCTCKACYTKDGNKCKLEKCISGGKCFNYGKVHPNNQCQDCQKTCEATWKNNNTLSCNDNNSCTRNDQCKDGMCRGTPCLTCERCSRFGCIVKRGFCVYKGKCYRKRGWKSRRFCRRKFFKG